MVFKQNGQADESLKTLATDLDGTLIPLEGQAEHQRDLKILKEQIDRGHLTLVFVTGRHLASVRDAIHTYELPVPAWLLADVGTTIYRSRVAGTWEPVVEYELHLDERSGGVQRGEVERALSEIAELRLQEHEKQGRHKLSYYVEDALREAVVERILEKLERLGAGYSIIDSRDPFTGDGLVDLLPSGVSKAYALAWWCEFAGVGRESVVFAGDSGNDLAALTAGYRSILVGNADRTLAEQVQRTHDDQGWTDRLVLAHREATSGVLEGCQKFGLLSSDQ